MTDRLGHKQTAAMLTLMVLAREVSNPELRTIVGFVIDGKERVQLNDLDLVASRKQGRCFVHELTDRGWAWCGGELAATTPPPPAPRSTLAAALYVLLGGLDGYLRRENLRLAHVFAADVEAAAEVDIEPVTEVDVEPTAAEIEHRIRIAYRELARSPRDWVGLVALRPMLGNAPTEEVDAVLKELSRTGQAHLVPESNRKVLTPADHDAAIRIGGGDNHLLSIETS
ncbi:hypothetical protein [Actinokineospora sp.]|uniref:hypothetical protein n=1 Tax=Actinokineospora sp. TaxID=1872133 RepID=UPI004037C2F6